MSKFLHIAFAVLLLVAGPATAQAEKRVALVIGNSSYAHATQLSNPKNDAIALAEKFRSIGFNKVTLKLDLDTTALRRTLGQFARDAAGADIAVVYFAGHGLEVDGTNYVIPTDARLAHVDDVDFEAIQLDVVMRALNRAKSLKLVILDACRDNPFKNNMQGVGGSRSVGRGFARVDPPGSDTLVAYAAKEGTVASDGGGKNSPYAEALIKHIATPNLDIRLLFGRVRDDVLRSTGRKQEPFIYGSLPGTEIHLAAAPKTVTGDNTATLAVQPAINTEALFWASIHKSTDPEVFEDYLKRFPDGTFSGLAQKWLNKLKADKTARLAQQTGGSASPPIHRCDELATFKHDPQKVVEGGYLTKPNAKAAISACRQAVAQHPNVARFEAQLGYALYIDEEYPEAITYLRKSSLKGHAHAKAVLAACYFHGEGVAVSKERGISLWKAAAALNHGQAMYALAYIYQDGDGVPKSKSEAIRWYKGAVERGLPSAMINLGIMYAEGNGVAKDLVEATRLYQRAAALDTPHAMYLLGNVYTYGGTGVAKNFAQALEWYRKAAVGGHGRAMRMLGDFYEHGRVVAQDHRVALEWYRKALAAPQWVPKAKLKTDVDRAIARLSKAMGD